jgi:hypothetical protein
MLQAITVILGENALLSVFKNKSIIVAGRPSDG